MMTTPNVHIGFVAKDASEPYRKNEALPIPVYLTPSREDFLTELQMPINAEAGKWVLSGVALFLTED